MSGPRRFLRRWCLPRLDGAWSLPADPAGFPVFLLMGQSNMAGFGCIRASDPWQASDFSPVPRVLALGGQGTVKSAKPRGWLRWRPTSHPLHLNQGSAGFGLGLPFAKVLLTGNPGLSIGLIPCAWGGAGIDVLGPGMPLYENTLLRARLAVANGTLAGVLWHQGETDAAAEPLARSHADKLARLIRQLRDDLESPRLPFLIGDLAPFGDDHRQAEAIRRRDLVRAGLRQVAEADPHASFVESNGLTGVDGVHFNRGSLVEFGERYATSFRDLRMNDGAAH